MSKQDSLDKYFVKRKNNENDASTKKALCWKWKYYHSINHRCKSTRWFRYSIHWQQLNYKTPTNTNNTQSMNNNSLQTLGSILINKTAEKRSYKPWHTQKFPWVIYQPNVVGFWDICRNDWKLGVPLFRDMNQKTKGGFTLVLFVNWKKHLVTTIESYEHGKYIPPSWIRRIRCRKWMLRILRPYKSRIYNLLIQYLTYMDGGR